ncbi:hypothetical protein R1flu_000438 [Riccia fluitans]|uniref:Uncharacterized protein n=1 Tax=Riccia fluitans TaxID=41844 RepID=A0ABD1Y0F0_9MARC
MRCRNMDLKGAILRIVCRAPYRHRCASRRVIRPGPGVALSAARLLRNLASGTLELAGGSESPMMRRSFPSRDPTEAVMALVYLRNRTPGGDGSATLHATFRMQGSDGSFLNDFLLGSSAQDGTGGFPELVAIIFPRGLQFPIDFDSVGIPVWLRLDYHSSFCFLLVVQRLGSIE